MKSPKKSQTLTQDELASIKRLHEDYQKINTKKEEKAKLYQEQERRQMQVKPQITQKSKEILEFSNYKPIYTNERLQKDREKQEEKELRLREKIGYIETQLDGQNEDQMSPINKGNLANSSKFGISQEKFLSNMTEREYRFKNKWNKNKLDYIEHQASLIKTSSPRKQEPQLNKDLFEPTRPASPQKLHNVSDRLNEYKDFYQKKRVVQDQQVYQYTFTPATSKKSKQLLKEKEKRLQEKQERILKSTVKEKQEGSKVNTFFLNQEGQSLLKNDDILAMLQKSIK
mmetsp:Transcript_31410/g.30754  ORF Transcript_31410/g.30754 Transcript_31410/m.30754 type:complete len:285 (+) Transcript_31410:366-1220(+)